MCSAILAIWTVLILEVDMKCHTVFEDIHKYVQSEKVLFAIMGLKTWLKLFNKSNDV